MRGTHTRPNERYNNTPGVQNLEHSEGPRKATMHPWVGGNGNQSFLVRAVAALVLVCGALTKDGRSNNAAEHRISSRLCGVGRNRQQ